MHVMCICLQINNWCAYQLSMSPFTYLYDCRQRTLNTLDSSLQCNTSPHALASWLYLNSIPLVIIVVNYGLFRPEWPKFSTKTEWGSKLLGWDSGPFWQVSVYFDSFDFILIVHFSLYYCIFYELVVCSYNFHQYFFVFLVFNIHIQKHE